MGIVYRKEMGARSHLIISEKNKKIEDVEKSLVFKISKKNWDTSSNKQAGRAGELVSQCQRHQR